MSIAVPCLASTTLTVTSPVTSPPIGAYIEVDLTNCPTGTIVNSAVPVPAVQKFYLNGANSITFIVADNVTQVVCTGTTSGYTNAVPNLLSTYTVSYVYAGAQTFLKTIMVPPGVFNFANLANIVSPPYAPGASAGPPGPAGGLQPTSTTTQTVVQSTNTSFLVNNLNGVLSSALYATTPNVNGIHLALTNTACAGAYLTGLGCVVEVSPLTTTAEAVHLLDFSPQTYLVDMRVGQQSEAYFNPGAAGQAGVFAGHTINVFSSQSNQAAGTSMLGAALTVNYNGFTGGSNIYSPGIDTTILPYFKTFYTAFGVNGTYSTPGQHDMIINHLNNTSVGDELIQSNFTACDGGLRDDGDEGCHPGDNEVLQSGSVFIGACATGCTAGSTVVTATGGSTQGEGRYLIDKNPAHLITTGLLTGGVISTAMVYPSATFSGTSFPVSTFFQTVSAIQSTPTDIAPGLTSVPIKTTGLPSGFSSTTSSLSGPGVACVSDSSAFTTNWEMANYTITNSTTLSLTLAKPHAAGATIAVGGLCGYGLEQTVDTVGALRQVFPVIGSYSTTGLYYAGAQAPIVGQIGQTSAYANFSVTITTVSRVSNVVTVNLSAANFGSFNIVGLPFVVTGVADSSFNNPCTILSIGSGFITCSQSGANATSTGGTMTYLTGAFVLYPMAETKSVYNPTTKLVDGYFGLFPNTVQWATGDTLEQPQYFQQQIHPGVIIISQTTPRIPTANQPGYIFGGINSTGFRGFTVDSQTATSSYYGHGGSHTLPDWASGVHGPWKYDFDVDAGDAGLFAAHCNSFGCTGPNAHYNLFTNDNATGGADSQQYDPSTSTYSTVVNNGSAGATMTFAPSGLSTQNITATNMLAAANGNITILATQILTNTGYVQAPTFAPAYKWGASHGHVLYSCDSGHDGFMAVVDDVAALVAGTTYNPTAAAGYVSAPVICSANSSTNVYTWLIY